jgi:hypothetical protein
VGRFRAKVGNYFFPYMHMGVKQKQTCNCLAIMGQASELFDSNFVGEIT